jgi:hypothetical protein
MEDVNSVVYTCLVIGGGGLLGLVFRFCGWRGWVAPILAFIVAPITFIAMRMAVYGNDQALFLFIYMFVGPVMCTVCRIVQK